MIARVPATAKRKVIRRREWEGANHSEPVVYLDEQAGFPYRRRLFDVYAEDGSKLGQIEGYEHSVTTKIAGTRFVRRGKRRLKVGRSWDDRESQADAIRRAIRGHRNEKQVNMKTRFQLTVVVDAEDEVPTSGITEALVGAVGGMTVCVPSYLPAIVDEVYDVKYLGLDPSEDV